MSLEGLLSLEAGSRIDIVGVQIRDGKLEFGRVGHSAFAISVGDWTFGPQSDTYEPSDGSTPDRGDPYYWDNSKSVGKSAAYVIGFQYNISFSMKGFIGDIKEYINSRR